MNPATPLAEGKGHNADQLKAIYLKHNKAVIDYVKKENLLIWNLKDGWAPLCEFLDCPIPNVPVPRVNEGSDKYFFDNLFKERLPR